jgi:hypothetical protein
VVVVTARIKLPAPPRGRGRRDLWRALGLHALLLPVWGFWAIVASFGSPSSGAGAFWLVAAAWVLVGLLLGTWWNEGRADLVPRVVVWAVFWWLALLLFPLLFIEGFRRGFVPAPPACSRSSEAAGPSSVQQAAFPVVESEPPRLGGLRGRDIVLAGLVAILVQTPVALLWNNTAVSALALAGVFLFTLLVIRQIRLRHSR